MVSVCVGGGACVGGWVGAGVCVLYMSVFIACCALCVKYIPDSSWCMSLCVYKSICVHYVS